MIDKTISHYRILCELGAGGMGVVYLAEDTLLKRRVAIKMLNASGNGNGQYRTRLLREARAVSQISHSHIATIHEFGDTPDGHPFIVMEFIDGETLADVIKRKTLTVQRTIEIISQVAEALSEAHSHGIVHRDIKPSNIAINHRGEVKVLDFGLAKQIEAETLQRDSGSSEENLLSTRTREGVILGTPLYLSPEQALGVPVDERSDIFSLGTVLYECLTGKQPFLATSVIEICAKVLRDNPPPPSRHNPNVSVRLDEITLKALSKQPEGRYQTADELLKDLQALEYKLKEERTIITNPIVPDAETKPITQRVRTGIHDILNQQRTLTIAFAGALLIGLALTGFWFLRNSAPPAPTPEAQRLYEEGLVHFYNGAFHQAKQAFIKATEADNKFALASARLAETYAEMDYEDKAQNEMLRAMNLLTGEHTALSSLDTTAVQASNAIVSRDLPNAIEKYKTVAEKSPNTKKVYSLLDLARTYEKNDSSDEAIKSYLEVLKISQNNAAALLKLGIIYSKQVKDTEANECFTNAEKSFRASYNNEGITEALYQKGRLSLDGGNLNDAKQILQSTLDVARNNNFRYQQIKTMLQLGSVYLTENKTELAKQYINDALTMSQAEETGSIAADGLIDYGYMFFVKGDFDKAIEQFNRASEMAKQSRSKRVEARASLSIGTVLAQQAKPDSAFSFIENALSFYESRKYRRITTQALLLRGRVCDNKAYYTCANESLNKALEIAKNLQDKSLVASSYQEISSSLGHQEKFSEALNNVEESIKINTSLGNKYLLGYDLLIKGNMLYQLGHPDEARLALEQSLATQGEEGNKQLSAWVALVNSRIALSQRIFNEAKRYGEQAVLLSSGKFRDISPQSKIVLGLSYSSLGDNNNAINSCREAFELAPLTSDPRIVSMARLALAESQIANNETNEAMTNALSAYESFSTLGLEDSKFRSLVLLAWVYHKINDDANTKKYVNLANEAIIGLQEAAKSDKNNLYFERADIKACQKRLKEITL